MLATGVIASKDCETANVGTGGHFNGEMVGADKEADGQEQPCGMLCCAVLCV